MTQTDVDLLVIGGGINGVGIARDAAGRGASVLLVEQDDLANHTSSASTKLIHGGLRYLEYFEIGLVRAALRERERWLTLAPHLVQPLTFVLPQTSGLRASWTIRLGLALYDRIGGRTRLPRSKRVDIPNSPFGEGLEAHVAHGFTYSDCRVDDSRFVIANAVDATEHGAEIRTRTRFVHGTRDRDGWRCTLIDTTTGAASTVTARILVNASGPWVTEILANRVNVQAAKAVRLVRGSHIVVPRLYEGSHAFMLQNPDRRIVFVIPYEERFSLIGTTETSVMNPNSGATPTTDEIRYLCDSANRYFTHKLLPADVAWSFSGVRPLFEDAAKDATAVTRDYVLDIDAPKQHAPLLSVFGGKITTYRKLAEQAVDKLLKYLPDATNAWTIDAPLPGADIGTKRLEDFVIELRLRYRFLPESAIVRLAHAYGTRARAVLGNARTVEDLGTHFGAGLYRAEVDYLIEHEWARTAEDILLRRSKLILHVTRDDEARLRAYLSTLRENDAGAYRLGVQR